MNYWQSELYIPIELNSAGTSFWQGLNIWDIKTDILKVLWQGEAKGG